MNHLAISLLGSFRVTLDGRPVTRFEADTARALLAYLALHAQAPCQRETLAGLLWPDQPEAEARHNLRTALSRLRGAIGDREADPPFLLITHQTIQINSESDYWLDADMFDGLLAACEAHAHPDLEACAPCIQRLSEAVDLYQGDLVSGFSLPSAPFEEWLVVERERRHRQAIEALHHLATYHTENGTYDQTERYARQQLELEPWREAAHRQLMRVLALGGQRGAALRQYEACVRVLQEELGVSPQEETVSLYRAIQEGQELVAAEPQPERYRLERKLSSKGAFCDTWLATDTVLERPVVVKCPKATPDPALRERFLAEARMLAGLNHPNVIQIHDALYDEKRGCFLLVIEYLEGYDLDEIFAAGWSLSLKDILDIAKRVLQALSYLHEQGVVHRDVKPANVRITYVEPGVKLFDFNLASYQAMLQQGTHYMAGTAPYMSPEQIEGLATDGRADLYSLGVILYQMIADGRLPFECADEDEMLETHLYAEPPPLSQCAPTVLPALEQVVMRLLAKDPGERYPSAEAVIEALDAIQIGPGVSNLPVWLTPFVGREREERRSREQVAALYERALTLVADQRWAEALSKTDEIRALDPRHPDLEGIADRARQEVTKMEQEAQRLKEQAAQAVDALPRRSLPGWVLLAIGGIVVIGIVLAVVALLSRAPGVGPEVTPTATSAIAAATATPSPEPVPSETAVSTRPPAATATPRPPTLTPTHTAAPSPTPSPYAGPVPAGARARLGKGMILEIAPSPNGDYLAVASSVGVYLYRLDTFQEIWPSLAEHLARCIAFSPDGTTLVSGAWDGTVILWDVEKGERLRTLEGHTDAVLSVAYSPDGTTLASGSLDDTVILWKAETGAQIRTLEGHTDDVLSVAYSPDGTTLASGSADSTVVLWDAETGEQIRTLRGHTDGVQSVAYSPDEATLASGSWDDTVILWEAETGAQMRTLERHTDAVFSVAFSPDGATLASGSLDGTVILWDVETVERQRTLEGHTDPVLSVAYSPDGTTLASGSADGTVILWDAETGERQRTLEGYTSSVHSVAYSPDGTTLASGSEDKYSTVILWDTETGEQMHTLEGHAYWVYSVAYSPDGTTLASGLYSGVILWNTKTGERLRTLGGRTRTVYRVAYSPDGTTLASGLSDGTVILWDVEMGEQIRTLKGHTDGVQSVAYSPDGATLASGSVDGTVILWDVETGAQIRTLRGHTDGVQSVAYSPDGATLASGSQDDMVILWKAETGAQIRTLEGHTSIVSSVAFSPDGTTLASGSADGTVILWDVETGERLRTLEGHTLYVYSVAYSPDGTTLASGSADGTVILWDVP